MRDCVRFFIITALFVASSATAEILPAPLAATFQPDFGTETAGFGDATAIDGKTVVIGASNQGRVYVYEPGLSGAWERTAVLDGTDLGLADREEFGSVVAISGDYLAVQTYLGSPDTLVNGRVCIYERDISGWSLDTVLFADSSYAFAHTGLALAMDGDRLAFGTPSEGRSTPSSGAVYLYRRVDGEGWVRLTKITTEAVGSVERFGNSVDICGTTLVVGSPLPYYRDTEMYPGEAYVFEVGDDGTVEQVATLVPEPFEIVRDLFGHRVSISPGQIVVSSHNGTPMSENHELGSAHVYRYSESAGWVHDTKLHFRMNELEESFGFDVESITNGALVTSRLMAPSRGMAYLFRRSEDGEWALARLIPEPAVAEGSTFGQSVAATDSLAIIGAPLHVSPNEITDEAAHLYDISLSDVNMPPVWSSGPSLAVDAVSEVSCVLRARDPEGMSVSYSLLSAPAGLTVSESGNLSWVPGDPDIGTHEVIVAAGDGEMSTTDTVSVTVLPRDAHYLNRLGGDRSRRTHVVRRIRTGCADMRRRPSRLRIGALPHRRARPRVPQGR